MGARGSMVTSPTRTVGPARASQSATPRPIRTRRPSPARRARPWRPLVLIRAMVVPPCRRGPPLGGPLQAQHVVDVLIDPPVLGEPVEPLQLPNGRLRLGPVPAVGIPQVEADRKSTRLNSSHVRISYAVFCLKKKKTT